VSPTFRLQVRSAERDPERFPEGDDALGERLFGQVCGALERGLPRPVMLALRHDQVDQYDIVPVLKAGPPHSPRMMAAIAGQDAVDSAALAGELRVRGPRMRQPALAVVVYVEWPDNRWWTAWQFIDRERNPLGEDPFVRKAVDGWPRPGGMGGWFARARRTGVRLRLQHHDDSPMVH